MSLKFLLAYRYLVGRNKFFFSFSNIIALLGIIIGLFSLLVVSSVMNGLSNDMAERIISTKGEIRIIREDYSPFLETDGFIDSLVNNYPQIIEGGPVNRDDLLIRRRHQTAYTETFGIDFNKHSKISNIFSMIKIGNPDESTFKNNGIIIGLDIAFNLVATIGDTIEVISPAVMTPSPLGLIPKTERFTIVGIFSTGFPEFDRLYCFIDIEKSKEFKRHNGADYIELKTNIRNFKYQKITQQIEKDLLGIKAEHWEIFHKTLFQAIKVEQIAMFAVMTIIIVLASFNIKGNFIRTITEKKAEIATLKTLGMDKINIFSFIMIMGLIVCGAGILIADLIAFLLLYLQVKYEFIQIPIPGFPFTAVPVDINLLRFIYFSLLTLLICTIGTIYPALKTMKIDIIKVLHEENE